MDQNFIPPSKMNFNTVSTYYIEKIFKVLFDSQTKVTHRDLFSTFTSIRQEQKIVQEILKRCEDFDWMSIFGFLKKQNIKEGHKVLLQQIIFKCLRVNPTKTFQIICRQDISVLLWKHTLHHSIFRIIYVVVFAQWQYGNFQYLQERQNGLLRSMLGDLCKLPLLVFQTEKSSIFYDNGDDTLKFRTSANIEYMLLEFVGLMKILPPIVTSQMLGVLGIQSLALSFKKGLKKLQQMNQKPNNQISLEQQQLIDNYEQYLEGIAGIFIYAIKIIFDGLCLETLQQLTTSQDHTQIRKKTFQQILKLQDIIQNFLIGPVYSKTPISNGQQISNLGLFRYKLIQLQVAILDKLSHFHLKQLTTDNILILTGKLGSEQVQFNVPDFDPFNIVKIYLSLNRWNNILQLDLIKLIDKSLSQQNYTTFFKRIYIKKFSNKKQGNPQLTNSQKCFSDTFLGTLVTEFRNRNFLYLSSLRFTSVGNTQTVYKISQLILLKCERQDKDYLMNQYYHFKSFVEEDLNKYSDYLFSNSESYFAGALVNTEDHVLESIREVVESDRTKSSNRSLLAIVSPPDSARKSNAQIHQKLQSQDKIQLDSIQPIKKRRRKQSFTDSNFIRKLQGLVSDRSYGNHRTTS